MKPETAVMACLVTLFTAAPLTLLAVLFFTRKAGTPRRGAEHEIPSVLMRLIPCDPDDPDVLPPDVILHVVQILASQDPGPTYLGTPCTRCRSTNTFREYRSEADEGRTYLWPYLVCTNCSASRSSVSLKRQVP